MSISALFCSRATVVYKQQVFYLSNSFVGLSIILFQEGRAYLSVRQCTDFYLLLDRNATD